MSVNDHLVAASEVEDEAARHEQIAEDREAAGVDVQPCGDTVLADQPSSGGEPLRPMSAPCWDGEADVVEAHRAEAERLRAEADEHRARANELLAAERERCAGLSGDALKVTPFAHRKDVAAVTPVLEGDAVRGAEIRFKKVKGLSATWLQAAIVCHRARAAALGYDPTYLGYDPTTVEHASVSVVDDEDGLIVIVRSTDDQTAQVVLGRAQDLLVEDAAAPPPPRT